MVQDRLRDGTRIAQLVASELTGNRGALEAVVVVDANPDVAPTDDGALAYRVAVVSDPAAISVDDRGQTALDETVAADPLTLASVFVHPDRARVEFRAAPDTAAEAARQAELRTRPKAVDPPRTLVFVEDGAEAKHVVPVFASVVDAVDAAVASTTTAADSGTDSDLGSDLDSDSDTAADSDLDLDSDTDSDLDSVDSTE